jgi:single-strand DNA-binding protein
MATEGLNKVILIGNLGQDPELKYTQGGQALLRLRLATTENYVNRSGERQERTEWHTVLVWGNRGEGLNKVLSKGGRIAVEGRIQYRQWEDQNGNRRNSTDIVATNVVLLGGGGGRGGGGGGGAPEPAPPDDFGGSGDAPGGDFGDDDIPF